MSDLTPETLAEWRNDAERDHARSSGIGYPHSRVLSLLDALAAEKAARAAAESWKDIWRKEADDEEARAVKAEQERDDLRARIEAHWPTSGSRWP